MNPMFFQFMNSQAGWMILEAITLLTLALTIFFFMRAFPWERPRKQPYLLPGRLNHLAQSSEDLCTGLSKNLAEKKELTQRLIEKLDSRILHLREQLEVTHPPKSGPPLDAKEPFPCGREGCLGKRKEPTPRFARPMEPAVTDEPPAWNERYGPSRSPSEKEMDLYGKAEKLLEAGYGFPEIVRRLHLPKGEVQLMMDLKRYCREG